MTIHFLTGRGGRGGRGGPRGGRGGQRGGGFGGGFKIDVGGSASKKMTFDD